MEEKENKVFQREKGRDGENVRCSFLPVTSGKREEGRHGKMRQERFLFSFRGLGRWQQPVKLVIQCLPVATIKEQTLFLSFPPYPNASLTDSSPFPSSAFFITRDEKEEMRSVEIKKEQELLTD